ncbi:MAG: O-acetylhomoserine aminocarboxypropyltransferase/cysteine synthase family protein [Ruminococcus callidus]|nr:O-acetylhomoserine aminocarboxypropyltransferase/cysteine synthase family protein [Ruminococcus callidus]
MNIETQCLHAGYTPGNGDPRVMPIVQSTTYTFDSTQHIADLFDKPTECIYSRFANPTVDAVEQKIAALEGGVGAMCTSSGQAASLISVLNLCSAGDSFICSSTIYGGTINLFSFTFKRFGIEAIFVDADADEETLMKAFKPNTKCVFGETLANPAIDIFDIEKFAKVAHANKVPLIVDNTFPTPILCRPFEFGADIVIHSTTKYMDGHAVQGGGVIVDSGNFDWEASGKFPDFTEPDESYHGIVYTKEFGNMAYIIKARMQLMRDFGCYPAAHSAFLLNLGLETLAVRMKQYCINAEKVADYLETVPCVSQIKYPSKYTGKQKELAEKYLSGGSGVITFTIDGGRQTAMKFMDSLELASNVVHVADIRTCVLHPASETHRQLTDEQLVAAGINPGLIRLSVGLENVDDIIADLKQAFEKIK